MAELKAVITANTSGFTAAMKSAERAVKALQPVLSGAGGALALGLAAAAAAAVGVKHALDMGGELSDLASRTGSTAGKMMVLQEAFKQSGMAADDVGPVMSKMQKAIAGAARDGGPAAAVFTRLGLAAGDLSAMDPAEALKKIGTAVTAIENPTDRAATSMEIFGKSGARMLALFGDSGGISTAADTLGAQASIMDRNAGVFDRVSDLINASSKKLEGVFVGLAEGTAPGLLSIVEAINKIDLTPVGQQLGIAAGMFLQGLNDGRIWSDIRDSATIALGTVANYWHTQMIGVVDAVGSLVPELINGAIQTLSFLTTADFWSGLKDALISAAMAFGEKLAYYVADVMAALRSIPGLADALAAPLDAAIAAGDAMGKGSQGATTSAAEKLAPFIAAQRASWEKALSAASTGFSAGTARANNVVDTSAAQERVNSTLSGIATSFDAAQAAAQAAFKQRAPDGLIPEIAARTQNGPLFSSTLAKIGGGGGTAGGNSLLTENRKQTNFLRIIAEKISGQTVALGLA